MPDKMFATFSRSTNGPRFVPLVAWEVIATLCRRTFVDVKLLQIGVPFFRRKAVATTNMPGGENARRFPDGMTLWIGVIVDTADASRDGLRSA